MVDVINTKTRKPDDRNRLKLPEDWVEACGLEGEDEVKVAFLYSQKYGYHMGVWKIGEQPGREDE